MSIIVDEGEESKRESRVYRRFLIANTAHLDLRDVSHIRNNLHLVCTIN